MRKILMSSTAVIGLLIGMSADPVDASAATISHHYVVTPDESSFNGQTISLDLFDSSLGTLQSVVVTETLTQNSVGRFAYVYNFSLTSTSRTHVSATVTTKLSIAGGPSILNGTPALSVTETSSQPATYQSRTNGSSLASYTFDNSFPDSGGTTIATPTITVLSEWEEAGGGSDLLTLSSEITDGMNGWDVAYDGSGPGVQYILDVQYNYAAAPEPASVLSMGAGLLGLAAFRRKRRRG